jgi:lipoprotein-anchoring transpeptidase ErfK/SrfK
VVRLRLVIALLGTVAVAACGTDDRGARAPTKPLLAGPDPADEFSPSGREPAAAVHGRYMTARVVDPTWLRSAPDGRRLRTLEPYTEFGSRQVVSVLRRENGWLQVIASQLPNERRGWIPERRARIRGTDYALHVDVSARRLELRHGGRVIRRARIAVGRPGNETPIGRFAVTDKLRPEYADSPYGCCAIALSGHQTKLEPGWVGGDRLAIHGTAQTETIGKPVSLGCMRAHARDLKVLMRRVPLGAPVFIRA